MRSNPQVYAQRIVERIGAWLRGEIPVLRVAELLVEATRELNPEDPEARRNVYAAALSQSRRQVAGSH